MHDELLDLVDSSDMVIGTIWRSEYTQLENEHLGYIRAAEMFIVNNAGELWIPTRTADKQIAPNGLDYSMGGHVSADETYMESALREIKEELNLDLRPNDLKTIHKFAPGTLPYFRMLYVYHSNTAPNYNPDDYVSAEWLSPQAVLEKIESGTPAKLTLHESIQYLVEDGSII